MFSRSSLTIPADVSYLSIVSAMVREISVELGFSGQAINEILLGLEEGLGLIVENSYGEDEKGDVTILCESKGQGLKIVLKSKGLPFDFSMVPEYDPALGPGADGAPDGLSKFLLKRSVDLCRFSILGKNGLELELLKYFPARDIADYPSESETPLVPQTNEPKEEIKEIRLLRSEDAVNISRLVHMSYGDTYISEDLYFPDRIRALQEQGMLISGGAVSTRGRIVGHMALIKESPEARSAEMGMAVVDPHLRGQNAMKHLVEFMIATAQSKGIEILYGHPVTNHIITQKVSAEYHFIDTGILIGYCPSTMRFRKINDALAQRETCLFSMRPLVKNLMPALFLPRAHRDILLQLCHRANLHPQEPPPKAVCMAEEDSAFTVEVKSFINTASLIVRSFGKDFERGIRKEILRLCLERIDMIFAFLDLESPLTPEACIAMEKQGFFFSGLIPESPFPYTLALQYANNTKVDFDRINVFTDIAQTLRAYVKEQYGRQQA